MVSTDYEPGKNRFTGRIVKVTIEVKPMAMGAGDKKLIKDAEAAAEAAEE
jgi:arylsulfatase